MGKLEPCRELAGQRWGSELTRDNTFLIPVNCVKSYQGDTKCQSVVFPGEKSPDGLVQAKPLQCKFLQIAVMAFHQGQLHELSCALSL